MVEARQYQWTAERQIGYPLILEVAPSPDGRQILHVVREPLMTEERSEFISHLYLAAADGGEPVQLTFGAHKNSGPRWSPDCRFIAFLSTRSGKANLFVMRASGGEAWALTAYEKTVITAVHWSPDGTRLGFLMAEPPDEEKEKARKAKDDPLVFDVDLDFARLYVVPFAIGPRTLPEPVRVTGGGSHAAAFEWLPDCSRLAVAARPSPVADTWPETRLVLVEAGGGEPTDLGPCADYVPALTVSPDGRWVACQTGDPPIRWAMGGRVVLYPTGGGEPHPLAATPDGQTIPFGWSSDSREVYVLDWRGVGTSLLALPIDGGQPRPLADTTLLLTLPAVSASGRIAAVGQDLDQPNAVYVLEDGSPRMAACPALPAEWPRAALPRAEVIHWQAPDGTTIEGILTYPLEYRPGARCPLIVSVHGGPAGVFVRSYTGSLEGYAHLAALAERGYAVLRPNPRGSSGYGLAFRRANERDWGYGDFQDIMAGVDHLVAQGLADPDRLGILGWSYGGFMTSWTITQTQRFKAACVGAALTNPISFNGTADIPSFLPDYFGAEFWDDLDAYRRHAPVLHAGSVRTPALIQHGEADVRVPVSQGREYYNALKRRGVPTELVIYPRQDHAFVEPRLIIDLRRRSVAWLDRWILGREI